MLHRLSFACAMKVTQDGPLVPEPPGSIMFREHAAHNVFIAIDTDSMSDLLGDTHTAKTEVAPLHLNDGRDEFRGGTFGGPAAGIDY